MPHFLFITFPHFLRSISKLHDWPYFPSSSLFSFKGFSLLALTLNVTVFWILHRFISQLIYWLFYLSVLSAARYTTGFTNVLEHNGMLLQTKCFLWVKCPLLHFCGSNSILFRSKFCFYLSQILFFPCL